MPFDTTYIFKSADGNSSWQVIKPGGKNKTVRVKEGDSVYYALKREFIDSVEHTEIVQFTTPEKPKYAETDYAPFVFFSILCAFVVLRFLKEKKQEEYRQSAASSRIEHTPYLTYYGAV